jgi:hypothetical protein
MSRLSRLKEIKGIRGTLYRLNQLQTRTGYGVRSISHAAQLRLSPGGTRLGVTAVVVGRNDDYMPDFRQRLEATISWNLKYLVDEVIFVEWNPPADRPLLATGLTEKFDKVRAFVVPTEYHQKICANSNIKLLEYHAKNVGIRRAQLPWVMSTNADAAVGLDTIAHLMEQPLDPEVVWTAQRIDIPWRERQQRTIGLLGSSRFRRITPYDPYGTGEFCLASRELWHQGRGFDEQMVRHRIGCDVRGTAQMLEHGGKLKRAGTVLHLSHPTSCTENIQPHHGELATIEGVPYYNSDNWGLGDCAEVQLSDRVWQLE